MSGHITLIERPTPECTARDPFDPEQPCHGQIVIDWMSAWSAGVEAPPGMVSAGDPGFRVLNCYCKRCGAMYHPGRLNLPSL